MSKTTQRTEQRPAPNGVGDFEIYRSTGDKFEIPQSEIPDGMSYEWKRTSTLGKEDPRNLADAARNRWTPVPIDRHPMIGADSQPEKIDGRNNPHVGCIVVDGLMLMERPQEITDYVRHDDRKNAKGQVRQQIQRLELVPKGTLSDESGKRNVSVQKERDLSIPEDEGYEA